MLQLEKIDVLLGKCPILEGITAFIEAGDFITIIGHNGAGKSTLFNILSGKLRPSSGAIYLDGKEITHQKEEERALKIRTLFQNPSCGSVGNMTVAENLALATYLGRVCGFRPGMRYMPRHEAINLLKPLGLGLENHFETPMKKLSGGQRQLIAFIMATLANPKLLLLDEPTAALDPISADKLIHLALDYAIRQKVAVVMVTHDMSYASSVGNKLWIMRQGKLQAEFGKEKESFSHPQLLGLMT
ncbi:MAG: ATP-binding cassette protein [Chlamydiales bacterium]|jgi:putative ABC transport system ATP-binding protein|nr:ATP-binding cassette protein [Chlamydiales bacterium]